MFGRRIRLFEIFGFEVKLDASWIIIAVLVAWSLSMGFFPSRFANLSPSAYWFMGVLGVLGLFASIIAHEMVHSLVARRFGIPMRGITLFMFGGVAEMSAEPPSAKAEFLMAAAGPLTSFLLALVLLAFYKAVGRFLPIPVAGVIRYLAMINGILAVFNLVPAFPLDGGRMLRAVLWGVKKNLRWATRIASRVGEGFGLALIILGVVQFVSGNFMGGMWWFLIGLFVRSAASSSYRQLIARKALQGETVQRFMNPHPVTVPPRITLEQLVRDYIYRYHFKMFPVIEGDRLVGCISTKQLKAVPEEEWGRKTVSETITSCSLENSIAPDADAVTALSQMNRYGLSRLMVVRGEELEGIIALKDLLEFLSLKVELEN